MDQNFPATCAAGLARLVAFAPGMGHAYADRRNTDRRPDAQPIFTWRHHAAMLS